LSIHLSIAIIGGGPAGLRAAEVAATSGAAVWLYDAQRSVGRKFLVAGKSGLNLTNAAEFEELAAVYSGEGLRPQMWRACLAKFDNRAMRAWAAGLGIETFDTSSGKVFPRTMKAAPLLRRWVERLRGLGVKFAMNHRWTGLEAGPPWRVTFHERGSGDEPGREILREHDAVVLALGGGSWPETGSDGGWVSILQGLGIGVSPLRAANCGWECAWTPETRALVEGRPLQNIHVRAGDAVEIGELMLTRYGIEGTVIYQLGRTLRAMAKPEIRIDFKPTFTVEQLVRKMESARRHFVQEARQRWKLPEAAGAIAEQFHGPFASAEALAQVVKDCRLPLLGPRPLEEAVSTAGGVRWEDLDDGLMLRKLPGVYCAGEMIDWEAPTGGYLLQGCFATGHQAGLAATGARGNYVAGPRESMEKVSKS
jgi:uncharacterized flavoprotein (TIGR03862 family)